MSFYGDLRDTAALLLKQFGHPATLRIETGSVYDPDAQTNVPAYADHAVNGLLLNYSGRLNESGTLVQTDDKRILLSAPEGTPTPAIGAIVVIGGTEYAVQNVKPLAPAGTSLLFEIQGRA